MTNSNASELIGRHVVTTSSANVYADLGFADPEIELAKATLALAISRAIESRNWTQVQAARALNLDQPKVSAILRGRLGGFSIERLMRVLNALDHDVEILVRAHGAGSSARTVVQLNDQTSRNRKKAAMTGS